MAKRPRTASRFRRLRLQTLQDRRVLAAITGTVFSDDNISLHQNDGESGLGQRLVYLDNNNNASLDAGERYALTSADGGYRFDQVPIGEHWVRLYNGTQSQEQTVPAAANLVSPVFESDDIVAAIPRMTLASGSPEERIAPAVVAIGNRIQLVADGDETPNSLEFSGDIRQLSRVAGGDVVVLADTTSGPRFWRVNDTLTSVTPLQTAGQAPAWTTASIDDVGDGLLLADDGEAQSLWLIDSTAPTLVPTIQIFPATAEVVGDTTPRVTDTIPRSLLTVPTIVDVDGTPVSSLAISIFSNADGQSISEDPVIVTGATEVVAFSDEAGLVVLRHLDGLSVHDVDGGLAMLYEIPLDAVGDAAPVAIDAARGLLMTLSPSASGVRLIDAENGSVVGDLAIDLAAVGSVSAITPDADWRAIVIVGAAGMAEVNLRTATGRRVAVTNGGVTPEVDFGVLITGDNAAPDYPEVPEYVTPEDVTLFRPAPALKVTAEDADGDSFVVLPAGQPSFGRSILSPAGSITYVPQPNFFGEDFVPVRLHDGRDLTDHLVKVTVLSVPDMPSGVRPIAVPLPENGGPGFPLGDLFIQDGDGPNGGGFFIGVNDPRFDIVDGNLVFVGGFLDHESEPVVILTVTVGDTSFDDTVDFDLELDIADSDDPIVSISPTTAGVDENAAGVPITFITVEDPDETIPNVLTVDDPRFTIVDGYLTLRDGESLDYERTPFVIVNVTATSRDHTLTQSVRVDVRDEAEPPMSIDLAGDTVTEMLPGDSVGIILVDGNPVDDRYDVTVTDDRFIVIDSVLELKEGIWVDVDDQSIINLEVIATLRDDRLIDSQGNHPSISGAFEIRVLVNETPFHNSEEPYDVNGDGRISAVDALAIINYINTFGVGTIGYGDPRYGFDVNGDGEITALDALLVINEINRQQTEVGVVIQEEPTTGEPSGEPLATDDSVTEGSATEGPAVVAPAPGGASERSAASGIPVVNGRGSEIAPPQSAATRLTTSRVSVQRMSEDRFDAVAMESGKAMGPQTPDPRGDLDDLLRRLSEAVQASDHTSSTDHVLGDASIDLLGD